MDYDSYYENVRTAYDGIARAYDESVGQYAVSQRAKKLALEIIANLTPPGGRVLDIGCYTGIEALALARQGFEVVGVDLSPEMVALASAKSKRSRLDGRARFQSLRASELSSLHGGSDPPFDTAYSVYGTLNLEPRIVQFKEALGPLLKAAGSFVCGLLNPTVLYELTLAPFFFKFHGYGKLAKRHVKTRIGLGSAVVDTFLYSPREFAAIMHPEFKLESVRGLHILYPPPRGRGGRDLWWVARALDPVERALESRSPFDSLGFFSLLVFRKA